MKHLSFITALLLALAPPLLAETPSAWQQCGECHEDAVNGFSHTVHARLRSFEVPNGVVGCASCHGDVSNHIETGEVESLVRFGSDADADSDACLTCHATRGQSEWHAAIHAGEVACSTCHPVHRAAAATAQCGSCHGDVQALTFAPSHHPLREGAMTCASCHNVHAANFGALATDGRGNDLCVSCHAAKEGPYIFQHDPVEEDCTICHTPHGSVADNLLVANEPFLCLQCHEFHFHAGLEARPEGPTFTVGGREYPNVLGSHGYQMSFSTKCTQCHSQVHGSDLPSQGISSNGRSITR